MTRNDFNKRCEDIATEEANENWELKETLDRIAASIGTVAIDFSFDTDNTVRELDV
jgi:hypothetical protein